jgi:NAD(P)-dependent dehydrogenase (short-subunit alcohol dehydrogenase family)
MGATSVLRALVTGATGGIGRATCFALLESARARGLRPAIAAVASRPGSMLDELVAEPASHGALAQAAHGDLTDSQQAANASATLTPQQHARSRSTFPCPSFRSTI